MLNGKRCAMNFVNNSVATVAVKEVVNEAEEVDARDRALVVEDLEADENQLRNIALL